MSDVSGALAAGRMASESRMLDTCRITGPGTGDPVWNDTTGQYDSPAATTVYEGKCYIPSRTGSSISAGVARAGEAAWKVGEFPLSLPVVGSEGVAPGQTVTYLTSATDPTLVGQVFGITEPLRQSQATARRFVMKQVVGTGA